MKMQQGPDGQWYIVDSATGEQLAGPYASQEQVLAAAKAVGVTLDNGPSTNWVVPSGDFAGLTWSQLLSHLKDGSATEQDVRQIIKDSPPTSNGVTLGSKAIESDIKASLPGAANAPDAMGNTPTGKIAQSVSSFVGNNVPTLQGAANAIQSAYANAPGLIQGAGMLPTSLSDADIAQRVAQGQSTAGAAYNTLIAKGYPADKALAYLQTNAKVPQSWVPNVSTQQPTQQQQQQSNDTSGGGLIQNLQTPFRTAQGALANGSLTNAPGDNSGAAAPGGTTTPADVDAALRAIGRDPAAAEQWRGLVQQNISNPDDVNRFIYLIGRESNGSPTAHNGVYPDNSYGLLQINLLAHGQNINAQQAQDPAQNIAYAAKLFKDQGFAPWATGPGQVYGDFPGALAIAGGSTSAGTGSGTTDSSGSTASTQGQWVTGSDGTPVYIPPTPKTQMTLEEQQAANRAAQGEQADQSRALIANYQASHPNANMYMTTKDGQYRVEDPKTGLTWNLAYDPSTGTLQESAPVFSGAVEQAGINAAGGAKGLGATEQQLADAAVRGALQPGGLADLGKILGVPNSSDANVLSALSGSGFSYVADPLYTQNKIALGSTGKLYQDVSLPATSPTTNALIRQANGLGPNEAPSGKAPAYLNAQSLGGLAAGVPSMNDTERNLYNTYGASLFNPALAGNSQYGGSTAQGPNGTEVPLVGGVPYNPVDPGAGQRIAAEVAGGAASGNASVLGGMSNADLQQLGQLQNQAYQNAGGGGPGTGPSAPVDASQFVPEWLKLLRMYGNQSAQPQDLASAIMPNVYHFDRGGGFTVNSPKVIIDAKTGRIEDVIGEGLDAQGRSIPEHVMVMPDRMPAGGLAMHVPGAHGYAYGTGDPYSISPTEQYGMNAAYDQAQHQQYLSDTMDRQINGGINPNLPQVSNAQLQQMTSAGTPFLSDQQIKDLNALGPGSPTDYNNLVSRMQNSGQTATLNDLYGAERARRLASSDYRWALAGLKPPTEVGVPAGMSPYALPPGLRASYNPTAEGASRYDAIKAQYANNPAGLDAEIAQLSAVQNPDFATLQRLNDLQTVKQDLAEAAYTAKANKIMGIGTYGQQGGGGLNLGNLVNGVGFGTEPPPMGTQPTRPGMVSALSSNRNPLSSLLGVA